MNTVPTAVINPPATVSKPGFIYMYTYRNMYNSLIERKLDQLKWLHVDNSILSNSSGKHISQWSSQHSILCKIGMTTKESVSTRLLEWQNTCKHQVLNLTPDKIEHLCQQEMMIHKERSLTSIFKKLSIRKDSTSSIVLAHSQLMNALKTYRNGGFYVNGNGNQTLAQLENTIHRVLWQKYGKGLIYCYGCDPKGGKRHTEWFRVPIRELPSITKMIDYYCQQASSGALP